MGSSFVFSALICYISVVISVVLGKQQFPINERTVSDLKQIENTKGLLVDYSYNETGLPGNHFSSPGCPKSIDGLPWIYYGKPPRCFLASQNGPCKQERRIMLEKKGSFYGICNCECFITRDFEVPLIYSPDKRYTFCSATEESTVFDNQDKVCYSLQERGSCAPGQWLVKDSAGTSVKCVDECPEDYSYDRNQGKCVNEPRTGVGAVFNTVDPNDCPKGHVHSAILQLCYPKPNSTNFIIVVG